MSLQNKAVFITDADSDSGKALIRRFADAGARLILNSPSGGQNIHPDLAYSQAAGVEAMVVNIDLCVSSDVGLMLAEAAHQIGTVDVLVHNQNLAVRTSVEAGDEKLFLDIMSTNTKSAFVCTQAIGRQMAAKQSGKIIYISSIHAEKPTGSSFAYSVSKGALKMLAREAALELGRYGVNVNTIEMGPVEGDDQTFKSEISTLYDCYTRKVPNAAVGSHDDLTDCVLYLAGGQSRYVNGADIRLDGGFVLHYMDHKMKKI